MIANNTNKNSEEFDLRGKDYQWGMWERIIPKQIGKDPASQRILEISLGRYETAAEYIQGKKVLDIACGAGYGCQMLAHAGAASVVGVDISPKTLAYAKENYGSEKVKFVCADAENFECSEKFDVVVSACTIEHLREPEKFLNRLHNLLVPNGYLIMSAPLGETRHFDPYHLHVFSEEDIFTLLKKTKFSLKQHRCDDWLFTFSDLMRWRREYPDNQAQISQLLFTPRGRMMIRAFFTKFIFEGGFNMPLLLTIAQPTN